MGYFEDRKKQLAYLATLERDEDDQSPDGVSLAEYLVEHEAQLVRADAEYDMLHADGWYVRYKIMGGRNDKPAETITHRFWHYPLGDAYRNREADKAGWNPGVNPDPCKVNEGIVLRVKRIGRSRRSTQTLNEVTSKIVLRGALG